MKKKVLSLLLALVMLLSMAPVSAFAATQTGIVPFNLNYSYNTSTKTLTVSGSGELRDTEYYSYFKTFAHLPVNEIKKVVIQSGVTELGDYAFKGFSEMTSITIPDTVTSIGKYAFDYCRSLESIKLPKNLTKIGERAFNDCFSLESITIPSKVTEVGAAAFSDNYVLKSVTFKGAFTTIGKSAFSGCESLKTVTFPAKAGKNASIEESAFYQCDALESIIIPEGVSYIGEDVFYGCDALKTVTLPSTLEYLWDSAFYGCNSLETVTFKGDAPRFGGYDVFGDVTTTAYYPAGNETWTEDVLKNYGGTITWKAVCMDGHNFVDGGCTNCDAVCVRIITQPQSAKVKDGEMAEATVVAEGPGLTYAWYYAAAGSKTFKKTDSFKSNTYSITMNESRAGRQIYCRITDANGYTVQTDTVTLAMDSELLITRQPESVMVGDGKTAAVTVKASGFGLKYEWYWAAPGSDDFALTTSFKTNTYSVAMNESRTGRQVYCKVYDKFGNMVQSDVATLTMAPPPVIVKDLEDVSVMVGETARVSVEMAESEGLTFEWYYAAGSKTFKKTDSFTGPEYFVTMNEARAGRRVYCVVTDQYGASVKTATVTLGMKSDLAIVQDLIDAVAARGKKVSITVKANGQGLSYKWYYSDDGGETFKLTNSFKTATYSLTMNDVRDGRQVYCVVTDKYGNTVQSSVATLTMVPPPQIVVEPTFVYAKKGEMATVSFEATGTGELTYEWYWAAAGSTAYKKTSTFTGPEYSVEMNDSRAGRKVYCVVTDESGASVKTKTVTVRMELEITKNIVSVCGRVGDRAVFTVEANGQGLTYEWYYADEGDETFKKTDTFKGNTYSVTYTSARMGRRVYCVITDKYGNTVQTNTASMEHD